MISDNTEIEREKQNSAECEMGEATKTETISTPLKTEIVEDQESILNTSIETSSKPKPCEDSAIILLTDEETDLSAISSDVPVITRAGTEDIETIEKQVEQKTNKTDRGVWVSNISKRMKAVDLKKLFSQHFKVHSAKIVTNGWSFFGHLTLENLEMAKKSVKTFDGFNFEQRKLVVSLSRPDLKSESRLKEKVKEKKKENEPESIVKEEKEFLGGESAEEISKNKQDLKKDKTSISSEVDIDVIASLKNELTSLKSDYRRTKKRLQTAYKLLDDERDRKAKLLKDISKLQLELKQEKKRFNEEKSYLEKKLKMEEVRYQADRSLINRELDECKKLRECLQNNLLEMNRCGRRRDRSLSPFNRDGNHSKSCAPASKRRIYEGPKERQHSPPPPPKLSKHSPVRRNRSSPYQPAKRPHVYNENVNGAHTYQPNAPFDANRNIPWSSFGHHYRQGGPPGINSNYSMNNGVSSMVSRPNVYGNFQKPFSGDARRY